MNSDMDTVSLLGEIFEADNLEQYMKQRIEPLGFPTLPEHLKELCSERSAVPDQIIVRAGIERTYGHQIFNGRKRPSRDKVLQLAFGLVLDFDGTQKLLRVSGHSTLYPNIKRDAVLIFAIKHKLNISEAQKLLGEHDCPPLGEGKKRGKF
jgi:hypothetical protein